MSDEDMDTLFDIYTFEGLGITDSPTSANSDDPIVKLETSQSKSSGAAILLQQGANASMGWLRSNARAVKHEVYVPVGSLQVTATYCCLSNPGLMFRERCLNYSAVECSKHTGSRNDARSPRKPHARGHQLSLSADPRHVAPLCGDGRSRATPTQRSVIIG